MSDPSLRKILALGHSMVNIELFWSFGFRKTLSVASHTLA